MKIWSVVVKLVSLFALFNQVKAASYPYLVHICPTNSQTKCNGILVTQEKVLTSAHCLSGVLHAQLYFGYSTERCSELTLDDHGLRVNSSSFRIHEKFEKFDEFNTTINDLAIIHLPVAARKISNQVELAKISNKPLNSYNNRVAFIDFVSINHSVYNIPLLIKDEEFCKKYLKQDFYSNQHGCAEVMDLQCKSCRYDSNGFPLEFDGIVFGMTTSYSPLKLRVVKLMAFANYNAWIYSKSVRKFVGSCIVLVMMTIVQVL